MKLHFLLLVSIFYFLFSALLPSPSLAAATCASLSGQCTRNIVCSSGETEKTGTCPPIVGRQFSTPQICCVPSTKNPTNCTDLGGYCKYYDLGCYPGDVDLGAKTECRDGSTIAQICCVKPSALFLCGTGVNFNKGINTAIGCLIAGDPKQLISQLLGWGVGVGGGIAFLMIVFAGFQIITAGGDPKLIQAGHELLISAISGLILIVLSVLILNLIGVNILKLPGFMDNTGLQL